MKHTHTEPAVCSCMCTLLYGDGDETSRLPHSAFKTMMQVQKALKQMQVHRVKTDYGGKLSLLSVLGFRRVHQGH